MSTTDSYTELRNRMMEWVMAHQDMRFEIDAKGHTVWFDVFNPMELSFKHFPPEELARLVTAWETGVPCDPVAFTLGKYSNEGCRFCHENQFVTDGFSITAVSECAHPEGFPLISCEIEIPSGEMLIGNDFRNGFTEPDAPTIMHATGMREVTEKYAEQGLIHFFVSNTSPTVYRTGSDHFTVASPAWNEDESSDEEWVHLEGQIVGDVITDLWWVSIMDGGEADRRGIDRGEDGWNTHTVRVTPGTYRLEYYAQASDFDFDAPGEKIYATLSRIDK